MNNGDIMILETIAQANRERYAEIEKQIPLEEIKNKALSMNITYEFPFEKALAKDGISYICEVKKASPSKGIIAEDFPYVQIAKDYENAGASAISVLTEPQWFKGENKYLQEISQNVKIPLLRKDFTVCEYQIRKSDLEKVSKSTKSLNSGSISTLEKSIFSGSATAGSAVFAAFLSESRLFIVGTLFVVLSYSTKLVLILLNSPYSNYPPYFIFLLYFESLCGQMM